MEKEREGKGKSGQQVRRTRKKKGAANADLEIPLSLENGPFPCDDQKKRRGKGEKGE
jgi:hypothetical protein